MIFDDPGLLIRLEGESDMIPRLATMFCENAATHIDSLASGRAPRQYGTGSHPVAHHQRGSGEYVGKSAESQLPTWRKLLFQGSPLPEPGC